MTRAKLEELIADLGYASMYLKQARMETKGADFQLNRTRELLGKVADALIAEGKNYHPGKKRGALEAIYNLPMDQKPWKDSRRLNVTKLASKTDLFVDAGLTNDQLSELYDIVVNEFENWDGEEVDVSHIVHLMVGRYTHHGLAPSRN